jgi:hypothetical protein
MFKMKSEIATSFVNVANRQYIGGQNCYKTSTLLNLVVIYIREILVIIINAD